MHPNQVREIRPGGVVRETIDYPAGFFFTFVSAMWG